MAKKIALVTGANKGIGYQTALQLGEKGYMVYVGARDLAKGEAAAAGLREKGIEARALKIDVTDAASIMAAATQVEMEAGHLDALVNNAGITNGGWGTPGLEIPIDQWKEVFETNLFGVIEVTKAFVPLLKKSEAGRIVNVSSILGSNSLHADPSSQIYNAKSIAYDASKAALNSYSIHVAYDLRDTAIKVNAAHPGWVKTDLGGPEAPMELADGAKTSVWLATLGADGPTGGYFHMQNPLPW